MNIACTACSARYGVADEKLVGKRVRITCKRCGTVLIVDGNYNPPTVSASTSMPPSPPASNRPATAPRTPAPAPEPPFMVAFADGRQEEADVAQIVRFHRAGQLGADSLVWRADLANWTDPWDVPQIAAAFRRMGYARPTPAPPPEPPAAQPLREAVEEEATQIHRSGPHHQAPLFDDSENTAVVDSSSRASAAPVRDPRVASRPVMEDDEVPTHVGTPTDARRSSAPPPEQQRARRTHSEAPARAARVSQAPARTSQAPARTSQAPARTSQAPARTSQAPARASLPPLQRESAEDEYRRARREAKARTTAQARSSRPPPGSPNAQPRDLFARHSRAGSEEEEQLEQPEPAPYAAPDADGPRLTGARNESSVLFSLDSLLKQEKKSSAPPPPRAPYRDEALLTDNGPLMGGGIAPALAAPDFNAPITAPPPRFSTAAPVFAEDEMPFARPRSSRAWLYVLVLLAFGGAGALGWKMGALRPLLSKLGGSPPTVASDTATPASAPRVTESASAKPEAAPSATASAAASASVAASASATATTTATAPGKQAPAATPPPARAASTPVARSTSASSSGTSHKESAESGDDAPAEKEAPSKETASAAKEAPASGGASTPFDTAAAKEALAGATGNVASCKEMGGPTGNGRVSITFAPSGRPTSVAVTGDLAGTTVGSCIARLYRAVRVPAFAGDPVTVAKGFAVQ